jgi:hypothetical protein
VTSAYPISTEALEDRVRDLAAKLGGWPSQRRVMRECRVGAPRADAALAAVKRSGFDPTKPARPLTLVPTNTAGPATSSPHTSSPAATGPDTRAPDTTGPNTDGAGDVADRDATAPEPASPAPAVGEDKGERPAATGASAPAAEGTDGGPDAPAVAVTDRQVTGVAETPADAPADAPAQRGARVPRWPLVAIALGAFVSIWSGWVGLGELTGFGPIHPLPGIWDEFVINTAITLPIGVEAYAAFALRAWLAPPTAGLPAAARRFARWSALGALALGAAGQIAYHLMVAAGLTQAPWQITAFVSCLPVIVLGCGAALTHLIHQPTDRIRAEVTR